MVLILFTESLDVRFTVGIEEFLAALLPRLFGLGRCDVPVRPTFPGQGTQVLAEIFHSGPAEEPVAVVVGCAEAMLVNGIHTPTVVSIHHHAVRQGAVALRVRTLSGYDGGPGQTGASEDQRSRGSQVES
jgi:hypothetical protein